MADFLEMVTFPEADAHELTKEEIKLAKIKFLQQSLAEEEKKTMLLITEKDLKEVNAFIERIGVRSVVLTAQPDVEQKIPEFLSVRDVSIITGLAPQVVRRHLQNGKYEGFQNAGENSTWNINRAQFMKHPNWQKFLKERNDGFERSQRIAKLALELLDDEEPVTAGDKE